MQKIMNLITENIIQKKWKIKMILWGNQAKTKDELRHDEKWIKASEAGN